MVIGRLVRSNACRHFEQWQVCQILEGAAAPLLAQAHQGHLHLSAVQGRLKHCRQHTSTAATRARARVRERALLMRRTHLGSLAAEAILEQASELGVAEGHKDEALLASLAQRIDAVGEGQQRPAGRTGDVAWDWACVPTL